MTVVILGGRAAGTASDSFCAPSLASARKGEGFPSLKKQRYVEEEK